MWGWPGLGSAGCPGCLEVSESHLPGVCWDCMIPLVVWAMMRKGMKINLRGPKAEEEGGPHHGQRTPLGKILETLTVHRGTLELPTIGP